MNGQLPSRKLIASGVAIVAAGALVATFALVRSADEGDGEPGNQIAEVLGQHPSLLNSRQLPIAYVAQKLAQQDASGEAGGEVVNGPAQEAYDARAYPHRWIAPTQQSRAATSYVAAAQRALTPAGQQVLSRAQGTTLAGTWQELGPRGGVQAAQTTYTGTRAIVSGRTTALVFAGPRCTEIKCGMYLGSAGGGVWRTSSALSPTPRWQSIGDTIPSTAIGSVYIAPKGDLYVGTGESNGSSDNEAGVGLYKSTDGGDSFSQVPTFVNALDFTVGRGISSIAVDPKNGDHMYVGTAVARHGAASVNGGRFTPPGAPKIGVYESTDGGQTWSRSLTEATDQVDPGTPNGADFFRGGISKIQFDPTHAHTVYASMFDYGLYRRVGSGAWKRIYAIGDPGAVATSASSRVEFALASLASGETRIYLGDSTYYAGPRAGLVRTDDATTTTPQWKELSSFTDGTPGFASYNFCATQCYYDMVVASPPGKPNQVFISGSMQYYELIAFGSLGVSNGRAVQRSTDGGVHFTDMTQDAQPEPNGLHPDHHALAFAPGTGGNVFFSASDGGVMQQHGPFVDRSGVCEKRGLEGVRLKDCQTWLSAIPTSNNEINQGLGTLQYQSVSASPNARILQGGTQDNGTWENDTNQGWVETVGGDGGQSGFNVDNSDIRYHSYYSPQHDVSFTGGNPTGWDWISDPLLNSGETSSFYVPFIADPVRGGTVFDGLQHVWRTTDNGGDRAYLQQHCNELTGDFTVQCGDWEPLGGDAGDLSGGDTTNYVVSIERATSDRSTMWAATRFGHMFLSSNADAADPGAVRYQRIDSKLGLPQRFVSGIAIDPANAYHVYISYSGYSAYSPGGHVYEVTWNPAKRTGTAHDLSLDIGDQPVTDIVYLPSTKALFASTDFGVVTLAQGGNTWVATQGLPRAAVYGLTLSGNEKTLVAATHGRGIWQLQVG